MNGFYRAMSVSLGTTLAVLCSPAITGGAPTSMLDTGKIAHAPLSTIPRVPPPIAGIKLLEDIFTRMHSLPQIAFNKKLKPVVAYQNQQAQSPMQQQSLADPSLVIKPQELARNSKIAMALPKVEYMPNLQAEGDQYYKAKDLKDSKERESAKKSLYRVPAMDHMARITGIVASQEKSGLFQGEPTLNDDRRYSSGKNERRKQASLKQSDRDDGLRPSAAAAPTSSAVAGKLGLQATNGMLSAMNGSSDALSQKYDIGRSADKAQSTPMLRDAEEHPGFVALGSAANKLYSITSEMQKAQQAASTVASSSRGRFNYSPNQYRQEPSGSGFKAAEHFNGSESHRAMTAAGTGVTEYKPMKGGFGGGGGSPAAPPPAVLEGTPSAGDEFAAGSNAGQPAAQPHLDQPSIYKYTHEYGNIPLGKAPARPSLQIAMNAPNVITGIPLLRLGTLSHEAESVLSSAYTIKQQQLEGWTVFTASKPHSSDTAVQLYIKHGMVEAMRIFDRALMPTDLGVGLGDSVQSLKSRFGEPAFLIREPGDYQPSSGQNYVYPISQVSFQLARARKGAPQVVSVLIFNVK